jgi:hypothetical protein
MGRVKRLVEVIEAVSWRAEIDTESPEWDWLADVPEKDWPRAIANAMTEDSETYPQFVRAADGPYSGPDYGAEVIR